MPRFAVTVEDPDTGVDQADVTTDDMDLALELALEELGNPLDQRDEGQVTIRIRTEA